MGNYIENCEQDIGCPYCGERITVFIDTSAGAQRYVEDCQVCCRPIEIAVSEDGNGRFQTDVRTDAE